MLVTFHINGLSGSAAAFPILHFIALMRKLGHEVEVLVHLPQDVKTGARLWEAGVPFEILGHAILDHPRQAIVHVRHLRMRHPHLSWT